MGVDEFDSPIAFRTRGIESYHDAAHCGFCRVCGGRFQSMLELWNHLHDDHPTSERRSRAIEAFPMGFQLERMQEVLPSEEWRANASSPPGIEFTSASSPPKGNAGRALPNAGRLSATPPTNTSPVGLHSVVQLQSPIFVASAPRALQQVSEGVPEGWDRWPETASKGTHPHIGVATSSPNSRPVTTQETPEPRKEEETVVIKDAQREASESTNDKAGRSVPHSGHNTRDKESKEDSPGSPSILE
ncbi:hypothetical protein TNCV_4674171 [Trichonephila clavipes]|nr:hypothetical protein TNCV_4674171 [Trichonephila clavipes]